MKNPWKGLDFYRESEILYGRDAEIESLYDYIKHNSQVVLYGRSGIGKSSIINAGIFPEARRDGMLPLAIKLAHDNSSSYVQQLKDVIRHKGIDAYEVVPALREDESLWEFFHRHQFFDGEGNRVRLLVVFDQFEEIFTLQNNEGVRQSFFSELADLFNDTIPEYIVEARKVVSDNVKKADAPAMEATENELNIDLSLEIDEEKEDARDYLASSSAHVVFVIREDFLSYLERYTVHIPVMRNNRFSLLPLNEEQAMDVILKPCPGLVDGEVARLIIKAVTQQQNYVVADGISIEVDAAVLSLFLSELFARKAVGDEHITAEMVTTLGLNIISDYYEKSVCDIPAHLIDILEEHLLTVEGRRDNRSKSSLIVAGLDEATIDSLVNEKKILRQFYYEGDLRIEFIHDILCPVILTRRERREQRLHLSQLEAQKEAARQEERNWIITRWASVMVGVICIVFGIFVAAKWNEVSKHEKRMNQLEQSLIVQVAKQKLNDRDIYGAMQLLVNVIDTTHYDRVDAQTAQYECLLRQALDSLNNSAYKCVARRSVSTYRDPVCLSRDGQWLSYQSIDDDLRICDARTMNEMYTFHANYPVSLKVTDFSEIGTTAWDYEQSYVECIVLQDDSVLLLCAFDTNLTPNSDDGDKSGVLLSMDYGVRWIYNACFMHHDSLMLVHSQNGVYVYDMTNFHPLSHSAPSCVFSTAVPNQEWCLTYELSPDQSLLLIQQGEYVYLYDTYSWNLRWKYHVGENLVGEYMICTHLGFSQNSKYACCLKIETNNGPDNIMLFFHVEVAENIQPIFAQNHCGESSFFGIDTDFYYHNQTVTLSGNDNQLNCVNIITGKKSVVAQNLPLQEIVVSIGDSVLLLFGKQWSVCSLNIKSKTAYKLNKKFGLLNDGEWGSRIFYSGGKLYVAERNHIISMFQFEEPASTNPKYDSEKCPHNDTLPMQYYWSLPDKVKKWINVNDYMNFYLGTDSTRLFTINYVCNEIEGRYMHNGEVFWSMSQPMYSRIQFLDDNRHVLIYPKDGNPYSIDVLPLPELVDSCKRVLGPYWQYKTKEEMYRYLK